MGGEFETGCIFESLPEHHVVQEDSGSLKEICSVWRIQDEAWPAWPSFAAFCGLSGTCGIGSLEGVRCVVERSEG